jgi:hypothetical protein
MNLDRNSKNLPAPAISGFSFTVENLPECRDFPFTSTDPARVCCNRPLGFKETVGDDAAEEYRIQMTRNDGLVALTVTGSLIDSTSD